MTDWRKEALSILREKGYDGVVFVPEPFMDGYEKQVDWENDCLNRADCILFWVPRGLDLPGFTTNVEYGEWMKSGKVVLGYPKNAERMRYLDYKAKENFIQITNSLPEAINQALSFIGEGANRKDGETCVPSFIWNTEAFQNWYKNLKEVGNRLESARVEWSFRVGPEKKIVFAWVLHVDVYITKEKRHKTNEFVFARGDICVAAAIHASKDHPISDSRIVLIKEFRSPVSNRDGYVHELPGGSSKKKEDIETIVAKEFEEEISVKIGKSRFDYVGTRQLCSTLSAHRAHLFVTMLTDDEMNEITKNVDKTHGVKDDTEKTYIEILSLKDIIGDSNIDWSMMGMIFSSIFPAMRKNKDSTDSIGSFFK
jgi:ADP-ribose pyrophosphatase YjhB (NUDIX family)